ncbi:MAG: FAD-binding protein, partial [Planctomycetaceae bacterium]
VSRRVLAFLDELDHIVSANAGRVYMAKDARMSKRAFEAFYPQWCEFAQYMDPVFCSDFWRRVTGG